MFYSVKSAEYLDGHRLALCFEDGSSGEVDFAKYIRRGGVFAKLADFRVFKAFEINPDFGVVSWGDVDIAPETLYEEVHGRRGVARTKKSALAVAEGRAKYVSRKRHG